MLLVKDAVYLDLWDIEHAVNDGKSRHSQRRHIHVITKSRVGIRNLVPISSDCEAGGEGEKAEEKEGERNQEEEADAEKNKDKRKQKQKQ